MKNVIFNDTGHEIEFKPNALLDEYLSMTKNELKANLTRLRERVCPACQSDDRSKAFAKFGFDYMECRVCGTVYMSPAPDDETIKKHYLASDAVRFWRENLFKATEEKRIEKIYAPRMQWIVDMTQEYLPQAGRVAVINEKNQAFVEGLVKTSFFEEKIIINPYFEAKAAGQANVVADCPANSLDVALAFETIDHTNDVNKLIGGIAEALVPGGLLFLTTISISGFDQQVLWENSKAIFPLDRINILSAGGLKQLFKRHGLEMLEYSTPGILDLDVVRNAVARGVEVPRFVKTLLAQANERTDRDFQRFLQVNKLSSFARLVLRKNI